MSVDRSFTRRSALAATGTLAVTGGALTLAGCGSSSGSGPTTAAAPTATTAVTSAAADPTTAASPSGDGGGDADPSPSAASSDTADRPSAASGADDAALARLATIPVGSAVAAKDAAGKPIVVAQPTAGKAVAFSAICTHMGCTVAPAGKTLNCPCHGSVYDAATGKVLSGPAPAPLPAVAVHVTDGKVFAGKA